MGLFDRLKKDLFDMAKKAVSEAIEEKIGMDGETSATPVRNTTSGGQGVQTTFAEADARFTQIFASSLPQYSVQRSVRFETGRADSIPVTYLFSNAAGPALAVILCDKHLHGRKRLSVTVEACQAKGIPVQCYYFQFRNDHDYVVDRLGQVLKN